MLGRRRASSSCTAFFLRLSSRTTTTRHNHSASSSSAPLVEFRRHQLRPGSLKAWLSHNQGGSSFAEEGDDASTQLRAVPIAGAGPLDTVTEFVLQPRGQVGRQSALPPIETWLMGVPSPCCDGVDGVVSRSAGLYAEATALLHDHGIQGLAALPPPSLVATDSDDGRDCIYELREYQLRLGYDTVPRFLELYGGGLPSKLGAEGTDPSTSLVSVMYCEVGPLNHVIELWRHGAGARAMEQSRAAARSAAEWRQAIAKIAELANTFSTSVLRPCPRLP